MYRDLERKLLGDIVGKLEVIKEFKQEIFNTFGHKI
jgi:hypothetical protein